MHQSGQWRDTRNTSFYSWGKISEGITPALVFNRAEPHDPLWLQQAGRRVDADKISYKLPDVTVHTTRDPSGGRQGGGQRRLNTASAGRAAKYTDGAQA